MIDLPPSAAVGRRIVAEERVRATGFAFARGTCSSSASATELDVVSIFNLVHHLPEERDRELCRMALAALRRGGCLVIGDSARPEPGETVVRARRDLEPALLRLEPQPQLQAVRDPRLDGGGGLRRGHGAPQRALALACGGRRPAAMILLTGATGTVGAALLRRLTADGALVRCLVRDPRRLGDQRVRVQIALGRPGRPALVSQRAAGRGDRRPSGRVDPRPAARLDRGAKRHGQPAVGAGGGARGGQTLPLLLGDGRSPPLEDAFLPRQGARPARRWKARRLETAVFSPSIVYAPGDPWLTLLERFSYLPAIPISGSGRALYQPIWAEDVADCVMAALMASGARRRSFELAGPQTLSYDDIVRVALRPTGRRRPAAPRSASRRAALAPPAGPPRRARRCSPPGTRRS